jgi:hypothetical protein
VGPSEITVTCRRVKIEAALPMGTQFKVNLKGSFFPCGPQANIFKGEKKDAMYRRGKWWWNSKIGFLEEGRNHTFPC